MLRPLRPSDKYDRERLKPNFRDHHHKLILLIPMRESVIGEEGSKSVFIQKDLDELEELFLKDFEGLGGPEIIRKPLKRGKWKNDLTNNVIVNEHTLYEIYGQRNKTVIDYFTELMENLHVRAIDRGAKQEIIVFEQSEVTFISEPSFSKEFLEHLLHKSE